MEEAARDAGIENLGHQAALDASGRALGMFGQLVRRESTLEAALVAATRYLPSFNSGLSCRPERRGPFALLRLDFNDPYAAGSGQTLEYWRGLLFDLIRRVLHRPAERDEVHCGTTDGMPSIVFPVSWLGRSPTWTVASRVVDERSVGEWLASAPA